MSERRLFIVGGNENKEDSNSLLKYFVDLAGEKEAKIVVLPTATREIEEKGENYRLFFSELGAGRVDVLKVEERRDTDRKSVVEAFDNITGVFFTGGDQLRLTSIIGGTRLSKKLHERFEKGLLIGGTSAGASIMSDTMIVEGKDEVAPSRGIVAMAPGLGFLKETIIDQHFDQRGRMGRLLAAVAQNPGIIGLGIDEDTAIIVDGEIFKIVGNQTVTIVDGSNINFSDIFQEEREKPLSLSNITLHVISHGYNFDFIHRIVKRRPERV